MKTASPPATTSSVQDVRVRSVATNIRDYYGGGGTERHGNSIFIFEVANLCIAHLGHLHHTLNQQQLNEIGRVDVVLVPVDGGSTLDLDGMVEVLTSLKAPLIIPMHFFSTYTLNRFTRAPEQGLGHRDGRRPLGRGVETYLADQAETAGAAGPLVLDGLLMAAEIQHRQIPLNGIEMHVAECGDGPLVLMCHGWPELWYSWRHQLLALADGRLSRRRARHARLRRDHGAGRCRRLHDPASMSATWSRSSTRSARSAR